MVKAVDKTKVPWWVSNAIVPLVNLTLAFIVSGLFIFIAGENPYQALKLILYGSFGYLEGFGYTLYYATNFIFTGLAFAIAFHCRLFNIGGEGQAYIGGLGVFLLAFYFSASACANRVVTGNFSVYVVRGGMGNYPRIFAGIQR